MNRKVKAPTHRLCVLLRELRETAGLSRATVAKATGTTIGTLGSYERGNRLPPLPALETLLAFYGHCLEAVPTGVDTMRRPTDIATELRMLAEQVEASTRMKARGDVDDHTASTGTGEEPTE
jgi:transcriptional regulator with XRE-family HTH domain